MPGQPSISRSDEQTRPGESTGARRVPSWFGEIALQIADDAHLTRVGACRWTLNRRNFERTFGVSVEMDRILAQLAGDGLPLSEAAGAIDAGDRENIVVQVLRLWTAGYLT